MRHCVPIDCLQHVYARIMDEESLASFQKEEMVRIINSSIGEEVFLETDDALRVVEVVSLATRNMRMGSDHTSGVRLFRSSESSGLNK